MLDNNIYGLTKGQASPTTLQSFQGKSSPYGVAEENLNPIALALAYDVSFVARGYSGQLKHLTDLIVEGVNHKGFSFIHALSPCVVFNDTYKYYGKKVTPIAPYENTSNKMRALEMWQDKNHIFLGTFYKDETRQTFNERDQGHSSASSRAMTTSISKTCSIAYARKTMDFSRDADSSFSRCGPVCPCARLEQNPILKSASW